MAQILSGSNSFLVISLWKCGDKSFNQRLSNSVREITLKDKKPYSTSRWPRCLSRFRKLTSLSIEVLPNFGLLTGSIASLMQELETLSALETLTIGTSEFSRSENPPSASYQSLPSLIKLHLLETPYYFPHCLFESLCCNIRELEMVQISAETDPTFGFLPRKLEILRSTLLIGDCVDFNLLFTKMPPNLTYIDTLALETRSDALLKVPKQVTINQLYALQVTWSYNDSLNCPPAVSQLELGSIDLESFASRGTTWASQLPRGLKILNLETPTLFNSATFAEFPGALTHLHAKISVDSAALQAVLPCPHLKYLSLPYESTSSLFQWLPNSIQTLNIRLSKSEAVKPLTVFPSTLTLLSIISYEEVALNLAAPLPDTLKTLRLHGLELALDQLVFLPSSLEELEFSWVVTTTPKEDLFDKFIHLKTLTINCWSLNRLHELPKQLVELTIRKLTDYPLIDAKTNFDYFEALPTTLVHLRLVYPMQRLPIVFSGRSFSTLQNLRSLTYKGKMFKGPVTNVKPYESSFESSLLRSVSRQLGLLEIRLSTIEAADLPFLPPRLKSLIISVASEKSLRDNVINSKEGLKLWPIGFNCGPELSAALGLIRTEAAKNRSAYPDPRILSS